MTIVKATKGTDGQTECDNLAAILNESRIGQSPASTGLDLTCEVIVWTPHSDITEYQGTRATIEAESVIPPNLEWPSGYDNLRWEDERFEYWLRRDRPEGVKGPRKRFLCVDWWKLRVDPRETASFEERTIKRKTQELADYIRRTSSAGQAELSRQWEAFYAAQRDSSFQAFKSRIPGMKKSKQERKR